MLDGSTRITERQDAASATRGLLDGLRGSPAAPRVGPTLEAYTHAMAAAEATDKHAWYAAIVNQFYDLVTDFYEYGWGHSFKFTTRFKGETMPKAAARGERELAMRLGLWPESRVLDVGCGVGGPMRSIARVSGAHIVGINNNDYQVGRTEAHNRALGLDRHCTVRKGDFMALPFEPESFDAAYAIAATCHAPSLEGVYAEVRRVLKPGGRFACVEWCTTARFDPDNHDHRGLREAVAAGNGLVAVLSMEEALAAARGAEFDVYRSRRFGADRRHSLVRAAGAARAFRRIVP